MRLAVAAVAGTQVVALVVWGHTSGHRIEVAEPDSRKVVVEDSQQALAEGSLEDVGEGNRAGAGEVVAELEVVEWEVVELARARARALGVGRGIARCLHRRD